MEGRDRGLIELFSRNLLRIEGEKKDKNLRYWAARSRCEDVHLPNTARSVNACTNLLDRVPDGGNTFQ